MEMPWGNEPAYAFLDRAFGRWPPATSITGSSAVSAPALLQTGLV
jgi:hypothetical protein